MPPVPLPVPVPLLVVTGPPGAGKSSVAPMLAADVSPSALVAADAFFGFLHRGGIDPWLPRAQAQNEAVIEAVAAAAGRLARERYVVVDGLIGPWFVPTFLAATGLAALDYVVLLPDEATCLHRVASRSGHGFGDLDAARLMHREFAAADVDTRHVLHDPPATPRDVAALIRHRRDQGLLTVQAR